MLYREWLESPQWAVLTVYERALLVDLLSQYNGSNNGDLTAAWSVMQRKGWNSSSTLHTALQGLIGKGWVDRTRQGGRHAASLYAVTVWPVNDCGGKHDAAPSPVASHRWRQNSLGVRVANECVRLAN